MVQALETRYAGCHFRSRLEARWAVFFDALGIEWQYEPEAFNVQVDDEYRGYLPDFYLPATRTWVEVKGSLAEVDWVKLACAVNFVFPHVDPGSTYYGYDNPGPDTPGLLLLGPVPRPTLEHTPTFPLLQHYKGVVLHPAIIIEKPCPLTRFQRYVPTLSVEYEEFFCAIADQDPSSDWIQTIKNVWPENAGWVRASNDSRADEALRAARSARFDRLS